MTTESTATPRAGRITGTLHTRGYVHPAPVKEKNLPGEISEESEAAGHHRDSGQEEHTDAR